MKTTFSILAITVCSIFFFSSCEDITDDSGNIASKLEGNWLVEETSSIYKSAQGFHNVSILVSQVDSNKIIIEDFYDIAESSITVDVNGLSLTINDQEFGDTYFVSGNGRVNSKYDKITWNYTVDDGSGEIDQVEATYTRLSQ